MLALAAELFPLARSMTGPGLRATLARLGRDLPMARHEVPTGTPVLDWTIPPEWRCEAARIETLDGRVLVDVADSNLHVVSYSEEIDRIVTRQELEAHLHSIPEHPEWIPYRTNFWSSGWGFCVSERQRAALPDGPFRVRIHATHFAGSLSYGEVVLPGTVDEEILVFTHCCHPSLANDNLSGIVVCEAAARAIASRDRRLGYRFVFAPTTIGSIAWLARNEARLERVRAGLVVTNLGDGAPLTYKRSRRGASIDRAAAFALERSGSPHRLLDFSPWGYDERQFCSPGFDMPIGRLSRSVEGEHPAYHSSGDDLSGLSARQLEEALTMVLQIASIVERDRIMVNLVPRGEPRLGVRGLHRPGGRVGHPSEAHLALLWVLNLSDGEHSLLEIASRSGLAFEQIAEAASELESAGLLSPFADAGGFVKRGVR